AERPELSVMADPVALQRAFRNVLENAIKYTPQGGEVRIRAGAAGPHAFVVVKDTGMGMSDDERARAFDFAFRGAGAVAPGARDLLAPDGYQVEAPTDPQAALPDLLRAAPDLVILDVNMPGMSGWELCALLRRQSSTRAVPVLFLTGRQEVKDRITAMQVGGSDYLAKPFGAEELR